MPDNNLNTTSDLKCLVVDLAQKGLISKGPKLVENRDLIQVEFCSAEKAHSMILSQEFNSIVIFADKESVLLFRLLDEFKVLFGAISSYQAIFTERPSPHFMAMAFEYGINNFFSSQSWELDLVYFLKQVAASFRNEFSTEKKVIALQKTLNDGETQKITMAKEELEKFAEYDFLAAYSYGRALEASGEFEKATERYGHSVGMNKYFIPAQSSLAECLLVTGRMDEALNVYSKLESFNPKDPTRKFMLSTAYLEIGETKKAEKTFEEAMRLDNKCPKRFEAEALRHLKKMEIEEAVRKLDFIDLAGPFVVAKVNEIGVGLSKKGKGMLALALYEKAHRIVRPELRYKITINAALASYRVGDYNQAIKYVNRCVEEHGGTFPKLEKIRTKVLEGIAGRGSPAA